MLILASPLSQIFNLTMSEGIFSDSLKILRFAPVSESGPTDGPTDDQSNYTQVLVTPVGARLFEKLGSDQIYPYLNNYKLLY